MPKGIGYGKSGPGKSKGSGMKRPTGGHDARKSGAVKQAKHGAEYGPGARSKGKPARKG